MAKQNKFKNKFKDRSAQLAAMTSFTEGTDVVRPDRGPEMVGKVNKEFLAICNAKHVLGGARYTSS